MECYGRNKGKHTGHRPKCHFYFAALQCPIDPLIQRYPPSPSLEEKDPSLALSYNLGKENKISASKISVYSCKTKAMSNNEDHSFFHNEG